MRCVYYSLAPGTHNYCENQWIQSIRSLRRHNRLIPVHLFVYNFSSFSIAREAERWGVTVHNLGDYRQYLHGLYLRGAILALFPTFHKLVSLCHVPSNDLSQILYLDCDTFLFRDVERLFDTYWDCDLYAREEPHSRRSYLGENIYHLDERVLESVAHEERLRPVEPFNSGVYLLNNRIWDRVTPLQFTQLDYGWRLLVGRYLRLGYEIPEVEKDIGDAVRNAATAFDRSRALQYPSNNHWIVEQVALWLTLGHVPGFRQGFFSRRDVAQSAEFVDVFQPGSECVVAHYFNNLETEFFSAVGSIPD